MPRNVHRSVINALVLCGADAGVRQSGGGPPSWASLWACRVAASGQGHPREPRSAKAVLVNNPTYYGVCSDLRAIVKLAHRRTVCWCLADEAHGTHFYFGENMPVSAMEAGADMAAVSMHKSGGSLTQSSLLLIGPQ